MKEQCEKHNEDYVIIKICHSCEEARQKLRAKRPSNMMDIAKILIPIQPLPQGAAPYYEGQTMAEVSKEAFKEDPLSEEEVIAKNEHLVIKSEK